jgi:hypothetical protein
MNVFKKNPKLRSVKTSGFVSKLKESDNKKLCSLPHSLYIHMCFVLKVNTEYFSKGY